MLRIIKDLPGHVLGIRASGEVTENDLNTVLRPALDSLANCTGKLNYLLVLDTGVQNFTAAAWWQDMVAGLKHFAEWNRIAVVTDQKAVEVFSDLFGLGVPGKSKGFKAGELGAAKAWVSQSKTNRTTTATIKKVARIALGANLVIAGIGHLTFARRDFRAQVPNWVPLEKDNTVVYSGFAEIALGSALILVPKKYESALGKIAAGFFTAVFPGNLAQYSHHRSGLGLDTDQKRFTRLFFQPLLIFWALKSTSK